MTILDYFFYNLAIFIKIEIDRKKVETLNKKIDVNDLQ